MATNISRRVRPPNSMELRMDSRCVWTMPEHDQHALKLAKGTEGSREDRDWLFGELCGSLILTLFQADE